MAVTEDDWTLINKASTDKEAISLLFQRHKDYVFRLAYGFLTDYSLAEDTVQAVFLKLQEKKFELQAQAKFTTWLYQFSLNTAREVARKRGRVFNIDETQPPEPNKDSTDELADNVIHLRDLSTALAALPLRQREVFILRYLEGLSTQETAAAIGCSEGTVKSHLSRASKAVEKQLNINPVTTGATLTPVT